MAEIPSTIAPDPVEGASEAGLSGVQPTNFGLDQAAQAAGQVGDVAFRAKLQGVRAQAAADRKAVAPLVQQLQNVNQDGFAAAAAVLKPSDAPGFAKAQADKAAANANGFLSQNSGDMTAGQVAEFQRASALETARIAGAANQHEANVMAAPLAAQAANLKASQVTQGVMDFNGAMAPDFENLKLNHVATSTDLPAQTDAVFQQHAATVLANTPDEIKPYVQAQLTQQRAAYQSEALQYQIAHGQTALLSGAEDQATTLANSVLSAPTSYANARDTLLPQIISNLPAGLQAQALKAGRNQLAIARINGLVQSDQADLAKSELNGGLYDSALEKEQKVSLLARVDAAAESSGPDAVAEAAKHIAAQQQLQAEVYARLSTGKSTGYNLATAANVLSPTEIAQGQLQLKAADTQFAAAGAVRAMSNAQVQSLAAAPAPDPTDPDYVTKLSTWQASQTAAAAELKARQNPGAWAFDTNSKPAMKGAGAAAAVVSQDRGAVNQANWAAFLQTDPSARHTAASTYAGFMLSSQSAAGIDPSARQIVPQTEAARLAAGVINAPAAQKLVAMQALAGIVDAMPLSFAMPDGSSAAPRALLAKQLLAAHMSPVELSAIVDFSDDPHGTKLGRFVAALNDPTLKKPMDKAEGQVLPNAVKAALTPFLSSVQPLPGAQDLAQARIDRTQLVARELMASQGLSAQKAAQTAAADMTAGYQYVDTWRMPAALANASTWNFGALGPLHANGAQLARAGAANLLGTLTGNNGANLYAPATNPGTPADQRRLYAAQVNTSGRWVTQPDDSGLTLMVPHTDGTWSQVADRYGRGVSATWQQLQQPNFNPFATPPANAVKGPNGAALPAVNKGAAFQALSWAVTGQESGFHDGQVSHAGALGRMQVTPATVQTYAPRLGLPVDLGRAQNDADYNTRIGNAALSDNLQHYGTGAGVGLALAAYNAGRGKLEGQTRGGQYRPGWLQTIGDPRTGNISLDDWVAKIPNPETRAYVQKVLPAALGRLQGMH